MVVFEQGLRVRDPGLHRQLSNPPPPISGTLKGELLYPSLLTAVGAGHYKLSKHHFTGWIWHLSNKIVLERQGADS